MATDSYLSYHKFLDYKSCPLRWKWKYLDKRTETDLDNPLNKLLGIVWGDMMEVFYRDKKYLLGPACSQWMLQTIEASFKKRADELGIVWDRPEKETALLEEGKAVVPEILKCLKFEKLLGDESEVEKTLYAGLPSGNRIGGRFDLRIRKDGAYRVIDFKGTKHPKTLDERQLSWYSLLHHAEKGAHPEYLGFWLTRFGCMKWISVSRARIKDFIEEIESTFRDIQAKKFEPTPGSKACKYCPYRSGCEAWTKHQAEHRRPSKITDEPDGLSEVLYLDE